MPIGKKELKLIAILCVIAYAFAFYKFVWQPVIPAINTVKGEIAAAQEKKELLEKDFKNIGVLKSQLATQITSNERIDEFLMSSANMVDSLEYVDKLTRLIGNNIREMNIAKPEQRYAVSGSNPAADDTELKENVGNNRIYYEIKMDFRAYMTYASAMELVKYIEGGTRRIKITKFFVKALSDGDIKTLTDAKVKQQQEQGSTDTTTPQAIITEGKLFDTNMTISIYSSNLRASDRMFEYSRHKLSRFIYSNGIMLTSFGSVGSLNATGPKSSLDEEFGNSDIVIKERSYLAAGENLQIFGVDRENSIIRLKTDGVADVHISLIGNSYIIDTLQNGKQSLGMTGNLPDKGVVTMAVAVDMPGIKENDKIRLNIKITNNSGRDLNITLDDLQKRVGIFDRKGNKIHSDSTAENTRII